MMKNHHSNGSPVSELVSNVGLHDHLCLIYETQDEQLSAAIPFIRIGLARGERCVYIADANTAATLMDAMRQYGIDVDAAVSEGRLTITNQVIYPHQGVFDPDQWIKIIGSLIKDAKSAGFSTLRLTGEMTWVAHTDPRLERLIEFEAKFNHLARDNDILGICHYDRKFFQPEAMLDILRIHPTVVYRGKICKNPYSVPPDEFLRPQHVEREVRRMLARMEEDTANKENLRQSEEEVRRLSGRLLQSQDEERRRIARDLHDSTSQDLVALETIIGQLQELVPSSDRKSRLLLSDVKALANKCIREVRTLSYVLHPPALDQIGLVGALRDHVKGFSKRSGIDVELELSPHVRRMPRDVELTLFRVVQESLTNIQRHSGGQRAKIRIDRNSNLMLEISDTAGRGSGRLPRSTSEPPFQLGVGILSMQERVNLIGGRLEIESSSAGTIVRVTIPLGDRSEESSHSTC